jgi:serine/threonine protein phosphatase PrpC
MLRLHPMRNALTSVVGAKAGTDVHVTEEELPHEALIVLTTDGVHGVLDDPRVERLLAGGKDDGELPARLAKAALASGSRDNCTVVVARYAGTSQPTRQA